jgi:2-polyprenyl-3-methyl-5-hydroxy-6-metoxy-1,4-benzoquinol methylase
MKLLRKKHIGEAIMVMKALMPTTMRRSIVLLSIYSAKMILMEKTILEMGCGMGVWTANLSKLGAWVYHFDLSRLSCGSTQFAASDKCARFLR